jgi:hypothetical protein
MIELTTKISKRINRDKNLLIEQIKKLPIVQIACEKSGIGRTTYYRWRKDDPEFAEKSDEALRTGRNLINDMAESQLLSEIKDKNMTAIMFWLKHNHPIYGNRLEVTTDHNNGEITPEQEKIIKKALEMGAIIPSQTQEDEQE